VDYRLALHDWFAEDDGSLPEVRIAGLEGQRDKALQVILTHATAPPRYSGDYRLHFVVNLAIRGQSLPDIGVDIVEEDAIVLDWRMGPEWDSVRIETFLGLIRQLITRFSGARLEPERGITAEADRHFRKTWLQYLSSS
jgi:hypothetical protein